MRRTSLTIARVGDPQIFVIGIHKSNQSSGSIHAKASFFEELGVCVAVYYGPYGGLRHMRQSLGAAGKYTKYVTCDCAIEGGIRF